MVQAALLFNGSLDGRKPKAAAGSSSFDIAQKPFFAIVAVIPKAEHTPKNNRLEIKFGKTTSPLVDIASAKCGTVNPASRIDASVNHGNSGGPLFNSVGELVGVVNAKHGSLSNFLQQVQNATPGASVSIVGINPIQVIQQLIGEMQRNLNLGIGYAIPTDHIGSLSSLVGNAIQN